MNSLNRKIDPLRGSMMPGASLLRQDFFLRGVEQDNDQSTENQGGDNLLDIRKQTTSCSNTSQDNGQGSSHSANHIPSTSAVNVANISEKNMAQKDVNSNRIEPNLKFVVDNYQVKKSSPSADSNAVTTTKDLISDLKSLILDEPSISNYSRPYQSNDEPNCSKNNLSYNADSNTSQCELNTTGSSDKASNSVLQSSTSTTNNNVSAASELEGSPLILPCSSTRQNESIPQPIPGPSNTSCVIVTSPEVAQKACPVARPGQYSPAQVNVPAQKSPEKRNNSRSARRARRSAAQDKRFATISKLPAIPSALGDPQQQLQGINVELPPNWEARLDAHGRVFYIDHERRTTTWHRPKSHQSNPAASMKVDQPRAAEIEANSHSNHSETIGANHPVAARVEDSTEQQRALLNRRYTLRRTISSRRPMKTLGEAIMDVSSRSHDAPLIDPVSLKASHSKQDAMILNHDSVDGNCMSGPSTNRARSYNLCVDQRFQTATAEPQPSTSHQSLLETGSNPVNDGTNSNQGPQVSPRNSSPIVSCPPALKFLNRSDFFNLLHLNDDALSLYTTSTNLKYIINKVRKDKTNSAYERFQHNKDLVAFLNKFSNKNEPLPHGWEIKMDGVGKCFFIDHVRKATTYVDPRLPTEMPLVNPHQIQHYDHRTPASVAAAAAAAAASSPVADEACRTDSDVVASSSRQPGLPENSSRASPAGNVVPSISQDPAGVANLAPDALQAGTSQPPIVSYEEKIVAFFKQPNIFDIIKERRSASNLLNCSLRERINQIRKGGINILKKYSHDVNLMMLISLFDVEIDSISTPTAPSRPAPQIRSSVGRVIIPAKRDFEEKLRYFYKKLEQKSFGQGPNKLKLGIRRDHILEDAFTKVMSVNSKKDLQRSRLYVSFAGEEGLDYGGPSREFFFLLSRELFNPYYGKLS